MENTASLRERVKRRPCRDFKTRSYAHLKQVGVKQTVTYAFALRTSLRAHRHPFVDADGHTLLEQVHVSRCIIACSITYLTSPH